MEVNVAYPSQYETEILLKDGSRMMMRPIRREDTERWLREETFWSNGASWGEKVSFRYEIDNRQFSTYSTSIQASVWKEDERIIGLFSGDKSIESFDKVVVEWTLSSSGKNPAPVISPIVVF